MTMFQFVYLKRRLSHDADHIDTVLGYLAALPHAPQLLLFPEGTDRSAENVAKSRAFVLAQGKAPYAHVLAPRSAGFVHCVRAARGSTPMLLDVTMAYRGAACQDEAALMRGDVPSEVHVHTQRVPLADLPRDERELATELERRWRAKDQLLAHFDTHGRFPGVPHASAGFRPLPKRLAALPPLWGLLTLYFVYLIFTSRIALSWWLTTQLLFVAGALGRIDLGEIERFWFYYARKRREGDK